ncbi:MAG: hypothetical protein QM729_00925 [Solirubrobacterales bacterium]
MTLRRILAVGTVAALASIVALSTAGGTASATGSCVWTKHTKRVVKHVKRHGKRKKVVRFKHYWTCEEAAGAPAGATTTGTPETTTTTPSEPVIEPEAEANALGVAAEDQGGFRYTLSRQKVRSGKLTVQLNDRGEDPHTMDMQKVDAEGEPEGPIVAELATEPGEQETGSVEVEPGTYRMWCTIGHHAEMGMEATIEVE